MNIYNKPLFVQNNFSYKNKKIILYIIVNIIDICNYNCYYCYNIMPRTHRKINMNSLYRFIEWCYNNINLTIVVDILGGEPTLHPDLFDFCTKIHTNYNTVKCHLTTNFTVHPNKIIKLLELGVTFNLSWHSIEKDRYNKVFIEKIKKIPLEYFDKHKVCVPVMYEPDFYKYSLSAFDELYSIYPNNVGLALIDNNHLSDQDRYKFEKNYTYTNEMIDEAQKRCNNSSYKHNQEWLSLIYRFKDKQCLIDPYTFQNNHELLDFFHYKCHAGIESLAIHYSGNISPCDDLYCGGKGVILGNINDTKYEKNKFHYVICNRHYCTCPYHSIKEKIFNVGN